MAVAPDDPIRNLIRRPAVSVHLDDSLRVVAEVFVEDSIGAAIVKGTNPPALVSERDIVRALAEGADPDRTRVSDVMTEDLAAADPHDPVIDVAFRMLDNEIRHMPVIEDGVVIGLVSGRDALRVFADRQRGR